MNLPQGIVVSWFDFDVSRCGWCERSVDHLIPGAIRIRQRKAVRFGLNFQLLDPQQKPPVLLFQLPLTDFVLRQTVPVVSQSADVIDGSFQDASFVLADVAEAVIIPAHIPLRFKYY